MQTSIPAEPPDAEPAVARLHPLADEAVLATWDHPDGTRAPGLTAVIDGAATERPYASLSLPTNPGESRTVFALRWPAAARRGGRLVVFDRSATAVAEGRLSPDAAIEPLDPESVMSGMAGAERLRLVDLVLEFCRTALGLQNAPRFAETCHRLLRVIAPASARIEVQVDLTRRLALCRGTLPAGFGPITAVYVVGRDWVRRSWILPGIGTGGPKKGQSPFHLVLDKAVIAAETMVVLRGASGLACRRIDASAASPRPLLEWLERNRGLPTALRDYLLKSLASCAANDAQAAAAVREMQLFLPLPRRRALARAKPVGGEIEAAIGRDAGGLFLAGWLRDPHAMVEEIRAVLPTGDSRSIAVPLHRFPRHDVAQQYREDPEARDPDKLGLAAYLPDEADAVPAYQHRFELRLSSGARLELIAPPQPSGLAEARAAVLGSVPTPFVTDSLLETCIGPAAGRLHAAYLASRRDPDIVVLGTPHARPSLSVVIPLYRNLEFLRFQMAAFALDRQFADAELVYVLDSPEQRGELEHLLRGLHGLYGLPLTLVVMSGNFGFSAANNAGAAAARGATLLFLNSDVIPDAPGWIGRMFDVFASDPAIGAVGPKLLFEDDSLQHAGMFFGRDLEGRWINQHFFKGFPRDFGPANRPRSVPAVTGAAVMVRRELHESIGGFTEDYVIGDYEDSDLCLKIRRQGRDIWYVPSAELYHLERRSIERHAGYMRGVASQYNAWLHAGRWNEAMRALMDREDGVPSLSLGEPA